MLASEMFSISILHIDGKIWHKKQRGIKIHYAKKLSQLQTLHIQLILGTTVQSVPPVVTVSGFSLILFRASVVISLLGC